MSDALLKGKRSPVERLIALPPDERKKVLKRLSDSDIEALLYDWKFWARPEQLPPEGAWSTWCIFAGRGAGKTRTAAEYVRDEIQSGRAKYPMCIGADAEDVRKVMVEGESGLLAISPPWFAPKYTPATKKLTYPNGIVVNLYGAHEPDKLRGPQSDLIWADEIAKWQYPTEAWDNAVFGNRLGRPRQVVTSTPKPIQLVRQFLNKDPSQRNLAPDPMVKIAPTMSTYDNLVNLAPEFIKLILKKYQGTRLAKQELMGMLLSDTPGALWTEDMIERDRLKYAQAPSLSEYERIIVAIDPAVTANKESNETGIVAVGKLRDHFYVLADESDQLKAWDWATRACALYHRIGADRIVAEVNNGGDLVENQLRIVDPNVAYKDVHASVGKRKRGEPVSALYEQRRVHHVGTFGELESQMTIWVPGTEEEEGFSPDRVDALVWGLTELAGLLITADLPPSTSSQSFR